MREGRPNPEALLASLQEQERRDTQGKLKIFFGAAAGVGKTYAMLVEAHERRRRTGVDVLVGVVETHGRAETEALLEGLPRLPLLEVEYRGAQLREFDIDAALARKPALLLLDELAHTNAPGSRHAKRWQDVEELLAAGIDVYTTLNVQHVESLWDAVAEITGVLVRETVPDSIIDRADEIEIIDLPPDDLLQRLKEGKVYIAPQIERALENFFRKGNLIALRELALRRTADRVDAQMESYRRAHGAEGAQPASGRLLVCIGRPSTAPRLVRAARRLATSLKVPWTALFVERPGASRGSLKDRDYLSDVLSFAEELGADIAVLSGLRISDEILAYAREHRVSAIVIGKPTRARWMELLFGSLASSLIRESEIDIFVVRGEAGEERDAAPAVLTASTPFPNYARGLVTVAVCTVLSLLARPFLDPSNLIMVYLLGVVLVAVRLGRGPAILASTLSVAAFDFFFVPPTMGFAVSDTQYFVTLISMLLAALVLSTMATRMRDQTQAARDRERRTAALYKLSRELAASQSVEDLLRTAVQIVEEIFVGRAVILLPGAGGSVTVRGGDPSLLGPGDHDRGVAQWVFDRDEAAGLGTQTLPAARSLYVPLTGSHGPTGVLGVQPANVRALLRPDQFRLLETCANQLGLAIERSLLSDEAERSRVQIETERLRNTLLSSVSHDLRTPLAAITGATSSLLEGNDHLTPDTRRELVESVAEEAARLNRLVGNVLDMTRLESGALQVRKEWHTLEEVVGAALERMGPRLDGRQVEVNLSDAPALVRLDDVLIEQVIFNLVENALKYTPAGTPIGIRAEVAGKEVWVEVLDRGPGLKSGEEHRVFEKFYRAREGSHPGGIGLGLTISRGIVEAHGGRLTAANRPGGGAVFRFSLPLESEPPELLPEPESKSPAGESGDGGRP